MNAHATQLAQGAVQMCRTFLESEDLLNLNNCPISTEIGTIKLMEQFSAIINNTLQTKCSYEKLIVSPQFYTFNTQSFWKICSKFSKISLVTAYPKQHTKVFKG